MQNSAIINITNWISFIGLILIVGIITMLVNKRTHTAQEYFVSNRKTTLFALIATLVMTELNTSTLVGFASLGYIYGFSAGLLAFVFLIGLLFYAISVAKKWKQFDGISVTTYFEKRYNPFIGYLTAIILLVAMIGFSANYIKSLTLIFSPLFPHLNEWVLSGLFCAIMALITLRGGLKAIIRIDIVSFIITFIVFPTVFYASFLQGNTQSISAAITDTARTPLPLSMLISLVIITMFTYILAPWYGQKIFSANSKSTAFKGVIIAAILISMIYLMAILSASNLSFQSGIDLKPQEAIPYLINQRLPIILKGIAYAMMFFIAATTLVGLWNTIASVFMAHHYKSLKTQNFRTSMIMTSLIAITSYLFANIFIDDIFQKMVLMNIPIAALAFALLGGFYWKRVSAIACLASIITGIVGGIFCYFYFGEPDYMWYWAVYVIPLEFMVGVAVTFIAPNKSQLDI